MPMLVIKSRLSPSYNGVSVAQLLWKIWYTKSEVIKNSVQESVTGNWQESRQCGREWLLAGFMVSVREQVSWLYASGRWHVEISNSHPAEDACSSQQIPPLIAGKVIQTINSWWKYYFHPETNICMVRLQLCWQTPNHLICFTCEILV